MPPLTTENAGALVSGGGTQADFKKEGSLMQATQASVAPATLQGVVERAFYYRGEPLEVGKKVTLPRLFALEMEAVKKLRLVNEPAAPAAQPASTPAAANPAEGKARKESSNAR